MDKNMFFDSLSDEELLNQIAQQKPMTPEELSLLSEKQNEMPLVGVPVENIPEQSPVVAPVINRNINRTQENTNTQNIQSNITEDDIIPNPPTPPMSRQEALLEEYMKLSGKEGTEELKSARERDRMLKVGGALGDALATIINAQGQRRAMIPGVQVQQGAGLGEITKMFETAPEVASDLSARREALLNQYKQLAEGRKIYQTKSGLVRLGEGDRPEELYSDPSVKRALEIAENRLSQGDTRLGLSEQAEVRRTKAQTWKEQEDEELKPKEIDTLNSIDATLDSLERLKGMNTEFLTGPVEGRISAISRAIGVDSGKKTQLASQMRIILTKYGKQMSGTAIGEKEFDRLEDQLPKETDSNEAFAAKLANFTSELENSRARFINEYGKIRNVEKFKTRDVLTKPETKPNSKNVIVRKDPKSGRRVEYDAETKKAIRFLD
jgi:hypothetical protein